MEKMGEKLNIEKEKIPEMPPDNVYLDGGVDSNVFRLGKDGDRVLKRYESLQKDDLRQNNKLAPESVKDILKQYRKDTLEAVQLLENDPNPCDQSIKMISGEWYKLHYIAVPQGDIIEVGKDGVVCSSGQEFIEGDNLESCFFGGGKAGADLSLDYKEYEFQESNLEELSIVLSKKLGVILRITPLNVKVRADHKEKIVFMYITDLTNNIHSSYVHTGPWDVDFHKKVKDSVVVSVNVDKKLSK